MRDSRASAFGKNPESSSPPRNSIRQPSSKQENRVKFVPSKVSASIDYDLDRDLRAWKALPQGRNFACARARAHVKSIFCHTLTHCCPNPSGIYDETLNVDRSRSGLRQRADFFGPGRRVDRFVWLLAELSATDVYLISPHATRRIHLIFDRAIPHLDPSSRNATFPPRETRHEMRNFCDVCTI